MTLWIAVQTGRNSYNCTSVKWRRRKGPPGNCRLGNVVQPYQTVYGLIARKANFPMQAGNVQYRDHQTPTQSENTILPARHSVTTVTFPRYLNITWKTWESLAATQWPNLGQEMASVVRYIPLHNMILRVIFLLAQDTLGLQSLHCNKY